MRKLNGWVCVVWLCVTGGAWAANGDPDESGIGGTGHRPTPVPERFSPPALPPSVELPFVMPPVANVPRLPEPAMPTITAPITPPATTVTVPK